MLPFIWARAVVKQYIFTSTLFAQSETSWSKAVPEDGHDGKGDIALCE